MPVLAVTGASGRLGRLAVQELLAQGVPAPDVVALARTPRKAADLAERGVQVRHADYSRPETLKAALTAVDRLLLVSSSEPGQRVVHHTNVIEAARAAEVSRIVYTSMLRADDTTNPLAGEHLDTEAALQASGLPFTLLRNGWYTELYTDQLPEYLERGWIPGAAGNGRVSAATRRDYAAAAAVALLQDDPGNRTYELGGPAFDLPELAHVISEVTATPVTYRDLSAEEYTSWLRETGLDPATADFVASLDASIAHGDLETDSQDLTQLLGRSATPLVDVMRDGTRDQRHLDRSPNPSAPRRRQPRPASRNPKEPLMPTVQALRTPDDRFADLPDFPFPPSYVDSLAGFEGLRAHYLDLGPVDAERTFLCLHGEPSWSYLYRKMIPILLSTGARVIAPDFFGFGRSDKPVDDSVYGFHFHRDFLLRLVEHLDLRDITLVVQDWGGTLGLTLPVDPAFRGRLHRLLVMNTVLPVGEPLGQHFYQWRSLVRNTPHLPVGQWMREAAPQLTDGEVAAYDAPYPDRRFQAGARTFPDLAMVTPEMEGVTEARAALRFWSKEWSGPSFMVIGAQDPDVATMQALRAGIRGCPEPLIIPDAGHFVQEHGQAPARAALQAFGDLP